MRLSDYEWKQGKNGVEIVNFDGFSDVSSSDPAGMARIFGDVLTASGAPVTEFTAMRTSAVFACVRLIAGAMASTPIPVYQRAGDVSTVVPNHPFTELFNEQPTPRFSASTFWEFVTAQMLLRGDGIAYIVRKNPYSPDIVGVVPIARQNVEIQRINDRLLYRISEYSDMGTQKYFVADQDDVLHFPGFGFNGLSSYSVIGWAARQAIGVSLAADQFAAQFFGSGAHMQYAVKSPKTMSPKQQHDFREAWIEHYCGTGYTGKPLILTEGLDVQELSMNAVDSQLLESRKWQVIDIARAFGVPPFMVGETDKQTSWGTGIESMSRGFVQYTLQPHITRFEQELNRKLFPLRNKYFMRFDTDASLRGDTAARTAFYQAALGGTQAPAWMTPNEVRQQENLPPIDGGGTLFVPQLAAGKTNSSPDPSGATKS
jgi:HK97 family phage portal protein